MQTMKDKVLGRIDRFDDGRAFSAKDFLDIASRGSIDMALSGLTRTGDIRRVRRGLYDKPKVNAALGGALSPDIDEAARALARKQRWKIVPEGAWAANLLGLSTQVPAQITYLTDGPNKDVPIGRRTVHFKHARPKAVAGLDGKFALVVQSLRHLGRGGVGPREIAILRRTLSPAEKDRLVKDTRFGTDWIYELAKRITVHEQCHRTGSSFCEEASGGQPVVPIRGRRAEYDCGLRGDEHHSERPDPLAGQGRHRGADTLH
jgi:hypothetical protein